MKTIKDLTAQIRGETAARNTAEQFAKAETQRADAAERALRSCTIERDRWMKRAEIAEAALAAVGTQR
ncbi:MULTISPECIES: hypothetical protein [Mesorhizobium]|uniref:Uncharacterized protein n=2 Tax=Mesorhizobium TaxID=68287 RepID=A0A271KHU0_9HYPH|nr:MULTISPECIES: hypothetical protein [Mesorhizobium]PAP94539.1 hypothetical protein CIT31_16195 [Mesorhizobium wenxiniae]PAQ06788.1 hypothetical protein CIT26_23635 [Mesorhizobium temperatum]